MESQEHIKNGERTVALVKERHSYEEGKIGIQKKGQYIVSQDEARHPQAITRQGWGDQPGRHTWREKNGEERKGSNTGKRVTT